MPQVSCCIQAVYDEREDQKCFSGGALQNAVFFIKQILQCFMYVHFD